MLGAASSEGGRSIIGPSDTPISASTPAYTSTPDLFPEISTREYHCQCARLAMPSSRLTLRVHVPMMLSTEADPMLFPVRDLTSLAEIPGTVLSSYVPSSSSNSHRSYHLSWLPPCSACDDGT